MSALKTGWSEQVRQVADREYVEPARGHAAEVRIPFGEFKAKLVKLGFPSGYANQVASPLESEKFWLPRGLEMVSPKNQPRRVDTVLEFRFVKREAAGEKRRETARERAERLTEKLRGLLKEEIAAHGGSEGFIRWVRSDEDEDAA